MRTLAGWRSPWIHSGGPSQAGAVTASFQTARTAPGSGIRPRSTAAVRPRAKLPCGGQRSSSVSAAGRRGGSGLVQGRQEGGQGVGRLPPRVTGARSAGSPGTQVVTIQGRGNRRGRLAQSLRDGNRQRQARGEGGQPGVLLEQEGVCVSASPRAAGRRGRRRAATAGCPSRAHRATGAGRPGRGAGRAADPGPAPQ